MRTSNTKPHLVLMKSLENKERRHHIRSRATSLVLAFELRDKAMIRDRLNRVKADGFDEGELIYLADVLREANYPEAADEVVEYFNLPIAG